MQYQLFIKPVTRTLNSLIFPRGICRFYRQASTMAAAVASSSSRFSTITTQFGQINLSEAAPTPVDYAKYSFELPHERYVGLLKCQLDPNARELETLVVRCKKQEAVPIARSNGKEKGKQKAGKAVPTEELYEIELLDTVLFPEGKRL